MNSSDENIVITSAVRTAVGSFNGSLKDMKAKDLGALVVKASIQKSNLNLNDVDELIMGQVLTSATGQNPARQTAIQAGLPVEKTATSVPDRTVLFSPNEKPEDSYSISGSPHNPMRI